MSGDTEKIIIAYRTLLLAERRRTVELRARLRRHDQIAAVVLCIVVALSIALTLWLTR